jgi:FMN-dependent NADH-azoreductase
MTKILTLRSSLSGAASVSNQLIDAALAQLPAEVVTRDLATHPLPHFDALSASALRAEAQTPEALARRTLSDQLIAEVQAADILLIGAPMYNFGIASTLKSWFDHVIRAAVTFRYSEAGPEGLIKGKRAILVLSRGGHYEGAMHAMDSQEPHLRTLLSFIGITEIEIILAEKLAFGPEALAASLASAQTRIDAALRRDLGLAA